jgi:hypothetical protein
VSDLRRHVSDEIAGLADRLADCAPHVGGQAAKKMRRLL